MDMVSLGKSQPALPFVKQLVRAAEFSLLKEAPWPWRANPIVGEVGALELVLGFWLLQPKETVPENWLVG